MKRRLLSLALALAMVLSLVPQWGFAESASGESQDAPAFLEPDEPSENYVNLKEAKASSATVSYQTDESAHLTVAVYSADGAQMLFSATEQVAPGTGTVSLDLGRTLPDSCKVSVFLTAVGSNMALCSSQDVYFTPQEPGGEGQDWQMDGDTLIFEGQGEVRRTDWYSYQDSIRKIVIGEGYTSIANSAFSKLAALEEVVLPDTLVSMGWGAFSNCTQLTTINLPEGLQSIGNSAFAGTGLKEVTLPTSLTSIGTSVFYNCRSLTKAVFQAPMEEIPGHLFSNCVSLRSVEIPGTFKSIERGVFWQCLRLEGFTLPEGLENIGEVAFGQCGSLNSITLPSTLKTVGSCAFQNCDSLHEIYYAGMRERLEQISMDGSWLYKNDIICQGESKESVTDPNYSLKDGVLTITSSIPDYTPSSRPGWYAEVDEITKIVLGDRVSSIGNFAFAGLTELREVDCPQNLWTIGRNAFDGCKNLEYVHYEGDRGPYIDASAFKSCSSLKEIPTASSVSAYAFMDCTSLREIHIGWNYVEDSTFQGCTGLETVHFEEGVESVNMYAFSDCTALTTVYIPVSMEHIYSGAFQNCTAVKTIRYAGTKAQWDQIDIMSVSDETWRNAQLICEGGDGEKNYQWEVKNGTLTVTGDGLLPYYSNRENNRPEWFERREEITELVIGEGITGIGDYCFADLPNLKTVQLPDSLVKFGDEAFQNCSALKAIRIPDGVTELGNYAFDGCSNLTDVELPEELSIFLAGVFQNCTSLKQITLPDAATSICSNQFKGCTALEEVRLSANLRTIEISAFEGCTALKKVQLPDSVKNIAESAFSGCTSLKEITIPDGVTQIAVSTFQNCTGLKYVHLNKNLAGIGKNAFAGCTGIVSADYPGTREEWAKVQVSEGNEYLEVTCADDVRSQEALEEQEPTETETIETELPETEPTETAPAETTEPASAETEPVAVEPAETEPTEIVTEEEEPAETVEEELELTGEEAAEMGYYVAPDGAIMESGETLPMAAISGLESAKGNVRTVSFAGLEKGQQYVLIVSLNPGDLTPDSLQYIAQAVSLDGTLRFHYVPRENVAAVVQLYGLSSQREVTLDREYLFLEPQGQAQQLTAKVIPEGWEEYLTWSSENEKIAKVTDGLVTPGSQGTTYITATVNHDGYVFSARCRVDVRSADRLDHVEKGVDSLTTELYSTAYPTIPLRPVFEQEDALSLQTALDAAEGGKLFASAEFKDAGAKAAFRLEVVDDQTLQVVPTAESLANAKAVKGSYKSGILLTTASGKQLEVTGKELTLSVKKNLPKLKTTTLNFNSFYSGQTQTLLVPGVTVESMKLDNSPKNPSWLTLTEGKLQLKANAPRKNASANVTLAVRTAEWAKDLTLTVPVKLSYTAPKLKLSANKLTFANAAGQNTGAELYLYASSKGESLAQLGIHGLTTRDRGFEVRDFALSTGRFVLVPTAENPCTAKTVTLLAQVEGTNETIPLKLSLTWKEPALKLSASTVTLQPREDKAQVAAAFDPACIKDPVVRSVVRNGQNAAGELEITASNGVLTVAATEKTVAGASYKVSLDLNGKQKKATVLTVKVATDKQVPSVTLKAQGTLDLAFPYNGIELIPTYKNFGGSDKITFRGKLLRGKTTIDIARIGDYFDVSASRLGIALFCKTGADLRSGDSVELEVNYGGECTAKVKLPIKQTQAKLKLGVTSAVLNPKVQDEVRIPFTSTTKDVRVTEPVVEILNSKKQNVTGQFSVQASDGVLVLSGKGNVAPGAYTVNVRASNAVDSKGKLVNANATAKLTVPAQAGVTVSAKVQGAMDPTGSGNVLIVTQLKNMSRDLTQEETAQVTVLETKGGEVKDVTEGFEWTQEGNLLTIGRLRGTTMDTGKKYSVRISYPSLYGKPTVTVSLPVKMAAAKLTAQNVTLYKNDPDGQATIVLSGLTTGRKVARMEASDKSFALVDLGGGQYALTLKQGAVAKSGNVKLSVYLEGNGGASPNATVTLKVTVR